MRDDLKTKAQLIEEINELRRKLELQNPLNEYETREGASIDIFDLNMMLDELPALIWRSAPDSRCVFVNKSWVEFTGRPFEESIGEGWISDLHPEDVERTLANYLESFAKRIIYRIEYRLKRRDGKYRNLLTIGHPYSNMKGVFAGFVGISYDITDSETFRNQIEHSRNMLNVIVESSPAGIFFIQNKRILWANDSLEKMLDYKIEELNKDDQKLIGEIILDFDSVRKSILSDLKLYGQTSKELQARRPDGSLIDVLLFGKPVDKGNIEKGQIYTFLDVTQKNSLELKKYEAKQLITETSRLVSIAAITTGITHEINQPLNVIRMASESISMWDALNNNMLPDFIVALVKKIDAGAKKIDDIVKHMRSLWIGAESENVREINLNDSASAALSLVLQQAHNHSIDIKADISSIPVIVKCNSMYAELILNNLILNAILAHDNSPKPEKWISIKTIREEKAVMEVSDNGPGLPDAPLEAIFDPFFSLSNYDKSSGIMLSIVKNITDRFGGEIEAFNNEFGGATFRIKFDFAR